VQIEISDIIQIVILAATAFYAVARIEGTTKLLTAELKHTSIAYTKLEKWLRATDEKVSSLCEDSVRHEEILKLIRDKK